MTARPDADDTSLIDGRANRAILGRGHEESRRSSAALRGSDGTVFVLVALDQTLALWRLCQTIVDPVLLEHS